jgi:hypothetical protein
MNELTQIPHGDAARVGLTLPDGLDIMEWKRVGHSLLRCKDSLQFWIGDWINYGQGSYGKDYEEAMSVFGDEGFDSYGYEKHTLECFSSVARSVEISLRREKLSFGHHKVVAGMPPDEQDYWLSKAEDEKLSVEALRQKTREGKAVKGLKGQSALAGMFDFGLWLVQSKKGFDELFKRRPLEKWEVSEVKDGIAKLEETKKPFVNELKRRGVGII